MVLRLYCAALASVTALCLLAPVVVAHTWLIDPPAHYQLFPRNAIVGTPCELYSSNHKPTKVQAGQEIDVSWGSMGHAGGYVRLALAPKWWMSFDIVDDDNDGSGNQDDQVIFSSNVIKYDCFGGGDCADCVNDDRPYSTKLVVPINLQDGVYVLQMWATGVGQASPHSYSCADLDISGGDTSIPAETNPLTPDNVTTVLDTCWSCWKDNPGTTACRPPHLVEGGFGFKWGEFAFPSEPIVKKPKKKLIGYAPHELGMGDTLIGIAKVYQCCCTPEDIAVTTGWGDVANAIIEMQFQTLIAGRKVIVPFYSDRRLCTPADPADFVNRAASVAPSLRGAVVVAMALAVAAVQVVL